MAACGAAVATDGQCSGGGLPVPPLRADHPPPFHHILPHWLPQPQVRKLTRLKAVTGDVFDELLMSVFALARGCCLQLHTFGIHTYHRMLPSIDPQFFT